MKIENQTILLTGANRGIGRALLTELAARGAKRIYAATRRPEELSELASEVIVPIRLDVTDRASVSAASKTATDVTILINNAGALAFGSLIDAPLELIARDLDTNYYGPLNVIRAFAPVIEGNGGGAIVNLLSVVALASMSGIGGYSASKAAAFSMTQAVRADLKNRGVSVHGVFPGPVDTDMATEINLPKTSPEDVATAIVAGIENGVEDIFPDPMSRQISEVWSVSPKTLETQFASMEG